MARHAGQAPSAQPVNAPWTDAGAPERLAIATRRRRSADQPTAPDHGQCDERDRAGCQDAAAREEVGCRGPDEEAQQEMTADEDGVADAQPAQTRRPNRRTRR